MPLFHQYRNILIPFSDLAYSNEHPISRSDRNQFIDYPSKMARLAKCNSSNTLLHQGYIDNEIWCKTGAKRVFQVFRTVFEPIRTSSKFIAYNIPYIPSNWLPTEGTMMMHQAERNKTMRSNI